jgi:hypothetical protein
VYCYENVYRLFIPWHAEAAPKNHKFIQPVPRSACIGLGKLTIRSLALLQREVFHGL